MYMNSGVCSYVAEQTKVNAKKKITSNVMSCLPFVSILVGAMGSCLYIS